MSDIENVEALAKRLREIDKTYAPDLDKIDEAFVQQLWQGQRFFSTNMEAIDRRAIRVLKPGVWNHDEGPDFMHAEIEIDGQLLVGDVEIHVKASDWYAHKHYLNSRYNRVILHAVFFDDDINLRTRLQNGKRVPTLELLRWIDVPIGDVFDETKKTEADATRFCRVTGNRLNLQVLRGVFESLGSERFLEKADAIRLFRTRLNFEQILYEGIMEALGYRHNSTPLRELAQRVPFEISIKIGVRDSNYSLRGGRAAPLAAGETFAGRGSRRPVYCGVREPMACFGACLTPGSHDSITVAFWQSSSF